MTEDKADKGQWHGGKGSVQKPKDQDKFAGKPPMPNGLERAWARKEKK